MKSKREYEEAAMAAGDWLVSGEKTHSPQCMDCMVYLPRFLVVLEGKMWASIHIYIECLGKCCL